MKIWKSYEILNSEENSLIEISVRQKYIRFTAIWACKNIKFPDIEGRDEGFKISRRLPTGSADFKFNWLILPLRPPTFLEFPRISLNFLGFRRSARFQISQPYGNFRRSRYLKLL